MFNFVFSIAILIQLTILVGLGVLMYQVIQQQGRMLVRLDNVGQSLERGGLGVAAGIAGPAGPAHGWGCH